jgi:hypothetical protein
LFRFFDCEKREKEENPHERNFTGKLRTAGTVGYFKARFAICQAFSEAVLKIQPH